METAIERFRRAVEGTDFEIYTNHKPLTYAFIENVDKCLPRQFWHLDYIEQLTTNIRCIKELDDNVADTLSRIEAIGNSVDHRALVAAQKNVTELSEIVKEGNCET